MSEEANGIMEWFEDYYIYGRVRRALRNGSVVRNAPLFSPSIWSVTDNIEYVSFSLSRSLAQKVGNIDR